MHISMWEVLVYVKLCDMPQGTLLSVAAWMGGAAGENGSVYVYGWVPSLSTWNYHDTIHWPYSNITQKVKKNFLIV